MRKLIFWVVMLAVLNLWALNGVVYRNLTKTEHFLVNAASVIIVFFIAVNLIKLIEKILKTPEKKNG